MHSMMAGQLQVEEGCALGLSQRAWQQLDALLEQLIVHLDCLKRLELLELLQLECSEYLEYL